MIDYIGGLCNRINRIALFWTDVVAARPMNNTSLLFPGFLGGVSADWKIKGIGDVDGDRKMDFIWQHTSGVVAVWLMNGLTIGSARISVSVSSELDAKKVGDVDGDSKIDLLWRNQFTGVVAI